MSYSNINEWKSTGNIAVDMVATAISIERKMNRAPKAIYLNNKYYDNYMLWLKFQWKNGNLTDEQMAVAELQGTKFDDIDIKKSDILTGAKPLLIEYWTAENANTVN